MRKVNNKGKNRGAKEKKIMTEIVATTSLPVDHLMATGYNTGAHSNYLGCKNFFSSRLEIEINFDLVYFR